MTSHSGFDDIVTVDPTELHIIFDLKKGHLSCSIQLTNKTERIVAYRFWPSSRIHLVSPDEATYVGTILPRSTSTVTVKLLGKEPPPKDKEWIGIGVYVVKDGVKAEYITRKNLLRRPISDEVNGTTSKGKGSESSFRKQSYNEMSSIVLFSDDEIKGATNGLSDSSKIE